jgi:hypothetical protein
MSDKYEYRGRKWEWIGDDSEDASHLHAVMNDTKWEELRQAMYVLDAKIPWRCKVLGRRYTSDWDGEWFYHFRLGDYADIEWTELKIPTDAPQPLWTSSADFRFPMSRRSSA